MRQTVAAAVVVVLAVAAIGAYLLAGSLGSHASTVTSSQGQNAAYPECSTLVNTVFSQGYEINTLVTSPSMKEGSIMCVTVAALNIDGRNLTQSTDQAMDIAFNITDSSGALVFQRNCPAVPNALLVNSTGTNSTIVSSLSCEGFWHTGSPYNGTVPGPGSYYIVARVSIPDQVLQGMYVASSSVSVKLTG